METALHSWCPPGVNYTITLGSNSFIGYVDDSTILKYPHLSRDAPTDPDSESAKLNETMRAEQEYGLFVEGEILQVLADHPRIVHLKGKQIHGLLLEYAPSGDVDSYLKAFPETPIALRLKWTLQALEAVNYIHSKGVRHGNIHPGNLLLDEQLDIKLCDFQGKLLNPDGTIRLDGRAGGDAKSRPAIDESDHKTDIFALGSAIYFIMQGYLPFPELDAMNDEQEIEQRWSLCQFPDLDELKGGSIVTKCWAGEYETAGEAILDFNNLT